MQRVHCAISETTHELFSNTTEYTNPLPTHVWVTGSLVTLFHRVTAAIAEGKRPVPFRTRKLSPPAPMVLHSTGCGRVGHRRTQLHNPEHPRPHRGRGCSAFPTTFCTQQSWHPNYRPDTPSTEPAPPAHVLDPVPAQHKQCQLPHPNPRTTHPDQRTRPDTDVDHGNPAPSRASTPATDLTPLLPS
jgi:hypothetical protein